MRQGMTAVALAAAAFATCAAGQAPPARAPSASSSSDVVVTARRDRPSGWREAETSHVAILSDGSEAEVVRLARNVERLHFLLSGLTGRTDAADGTVKLRVTLIGDVAAFQALDLRNLRWQQGPFSELFSLSRFYDPRAGGAVMATTRVDQIVRVEHSQATPERVLGYLGGQNLAGQNLGPGNPGPTAADQAAIASALVGNFATAGMRGPNDLTVGTGEPTIPVTAESLLYAGYAQHYLLTYFPAAYPRWYLDGFAQIFASMVVRGDNVIEFGRSPRGTSAVLDVFGPFQLAAILDDGYLTQTSHGTG